MSDVTLDASRVFDPARSASGVEGADALQGDEIPCADEQIHIPGSIQTHGFLLGIDPDREVVLFASENAAQYLGVPLKLILGATPELFLERELLASLRLLRCSIDPEGLVTFLGSFRVGGELFSVVTHCVGGRRIVEFERQDRLVGPELMNSVITNFVGTLSRLESELELVQAITKQVSTLTGFDRVLLYSFDAAGHGTVLAEENNGTLPSYLDLRFPASDIPAQARALYVSNTIRIIPDAGYTPSPLAAQPGQMTEPLDMSLCILRSVSPVHLEYMRNMGTMASMSISIMVEGRLWGLISGHHATPHTVPFLIRSACDMLTKMLGTQLNAFRTASKLRTMVRFHDVQRRMLTQMAAENDYVAAISTQMPSLMQVTDAAGATFAMDGHFFCTGETPGDEFLRKLVAWLESLPQQEIFATHHLREHLPEAAEDAGVASGLMAIRISEVHRRYVLWFRPEVVRTVKWAGEPVKQMDTELHLHPRQSFAAWKETLREQSMPWSEVELESAREFRNAVTTITLRRAEEEAELNEARFNKLTQALPIKIFAVTDEGYLSYVNARWREAGLPREGLWYRSPMMLQEDASRCEQSWQRAVEQEAELEEEIRLLDPQSGAEFWNLVRLSPFRREGANRAGWIGTCVDLTERKEREAAIRLTEKLTLTGRMTSFLAHEINNPLEAITNLLFLLRQESGQGSASPEYFGMVDAELERISSSVKQTLRWSTENSGKMSWTPVASLFEDVVRLLGAKIRNRSVTVEMEVAPELPVYGIRGQIRQVLMHLVSNALDATPVGGTIRLRARRIETGPEPMLEMTVQDNGPGIGEKDQNQLFKPFFSTKGDLGNGLGLYISREIAERHHGTLTLESSPGQGTTARFCLPVVDGNVE